MLGDAAVPATGAGSARLRLVAAGALAGLGAGLVAGVGARVAMRVVAVAAGRFPELSEATVIIVVLGGLLGVAPGIAFPAVRRFLPGAAAVRGALYGLMLFLALGLPALQRGSDPELSIGPPWLGRTLFAALGPLYGLVLAGAQAWLERRLPPPRRGVLTILGYGLLTVTVLVGVPLFAAFVADAVLGIELPPLI